MPKRPAQDPQLTIFAPTGRKNRDGTPYRRYRVRLGGRTMYYRGPVGLPGSPEHKRAEAWYYTLMAGWKAGGDAAIRPTSVEGISIGELVDAYLLHLGDRDAKTECRGRLRSNASPILLAFKAHAGNAPARKYNAAKLIAWRLLLATTRTESGRRLSRQYINGKVIRCVQRMFAWAKGVSAGEDVLVPREVYADLIAIDPLRKGETTAPEREPVVDVPDSVVDETMPHLNPIVADVVRLIRMTGARPSEICGLTPSMIDRTIDPVIWVAVLDRHKNSERGKARTLTFDRAAQLILSKYMLGTPEDSPLFTGGKLRESMTQERHARRKSKPTPAQLADMRAASESRAEDRNPLDESVVQNHVRRACKAHGIVRWNIYQLRHAAITEASRKVDRECAQIVGGHSTMRTTRGYLHEDIDVALRARRKLSESVA